MGKSDNNKKDRCTKEVDTRHDEEVDQKSVEINLLPVEALEFFRNQYLLKK